MDGGILEWGFGIALVGVYAYQRFNTPTRNRFSTTRGRFIRSAFFYIFAVEILFFLLVAMLSITTPDGDEILYLIGLDSLTGKQGDLSKQLLAALALTTLLPSFNKLTAIDEKLRKFSWRVGHIPGMAYQLASRMREARFETPEEFIKPLRRDLGPAFPKDAFRPEDDGSLEHLWTRVATLTIAIKEWARQDIVTKSDWSDSDRTQWESLRVVNQHLKEDYRVLTESFEALKERAATCFLATSKAVSNDVAAQEYRNDFREQVDRHYQDLSLYCACGLLLRGRSRAARHQLLLRMGFLNVIGNVRSKTPIHYLAALYLLILTIFTVTVAILKIILDLPNVETGKFDAVKLMTIAPMIVTIYFGGIILALMPKGFRETTITEDRSGTFDRPFGTYLLSGILAVGAGVIISFIFRSIMEEDFRAGFEAFYWTHPWFLSSFVFAFFVAFLADNFQGRMAPRWLPIFEGITLASILTGINYYLILPWLDVQFSKTTEQVWSWMNWKVPPSTVGMPNEHAVLGVSIAIGFIAGLVVPWFYRNWVAVSAHERLIKHLQLYRLEIIDQINRLKSPGTVLQGLAFGCAYVAASDNVVDDVERDRFELIMDELGRAKVNAFNRTVVEDLFNQYATRIEATLNDGKSINEGFPEEMRDLGEFKGRTDLARLLIRCCESIACADRRVRQVECDALAKIVSAVEIEKTEIAIRRQPGLLRGE